MESNEIREQLREAERAAAAPYVVYPKDPWWVVLLLSLVLPLMCVALAQTQDGAGGAGPWLFVPSVAISGIVITVASVQRRRRGTFPAGKAPRELRRVYLGYSIGALVLGLTAVVLGFRAPLSVSLPIAFALNAGGLLWFGVAHDRAATRIRARLA